MQKSSSKNVCKNDVKSLTIHFKITAERHPREGQGVPNEPRGVPDASRRRPRVSKKRPGDVQGIQNEPRGVPEASQRRPEGAQECQRRVQEAKMSI